MVARRHFTLAPLAAERQDVRRPRTFQIRRRPVAKSSHRLYWVALGAATGLVACGPARMPPRGAELGARIGAALEVDHAQIYVTPGGAPEAAALRAAGLF